MINEYSAKKECFVLPFFEWDFISILRLRFVVLAIKAIGRQGTNLIKHSGAMVEPLGIGIGFSCSHVSTHCVVVSQLKACKDKR